MSSAFHIKNLFDVEGKVILITGGSRGIGKMIATAFVSNGAKVYITSRSASECQATAKELNELGPGSCTSIPADLQNYTEVERLASEIASREKALHVLVNNAGAAWGSPIDDYSDAGFTKIITLNLQRVFTLTQKLLPLLRAAAAASRQGETYSDPARIINIGSIEGLGVPGHETYAYSASKAGLHHLSRHLGGRLGWEGIVSNTIACGPFETKMMEHTLENARDYVVGSIPLQRIGKPEDVAGAALFLASKAGAFVNAATIRLDGGFLVSQPGHQAAGLAHRESAKL